jgi:thiamine-phosphate pyrophosphorylase
VFNSKNRHGIGIETLNSICNLHPKVIALGGIISDKEIEEIKKSKAVGFAAIRYFFT